MKGKVVIVVLAVLFIAYFVFTRNSSAPHSTLSATTSSVDSRSTPAVTVSPTVDSSIRSEAGLASRPVDAANSYYIAYGECMFKPSGEAKSSGNVSQYCQTHNRYGADDLPANLAAGGIAKAGADPITCSQNPPSEVKTGDVNTGEGGITTVTMQESFGAGQTEEIKVDVELIDNEWKVTNIHCPIPR